MTTFRKVVGFEEVWRAPIPARYSRGGSPSKRQIVGSDDKARLARVVAKAPEVFVGVTGRSYTTDRLKAHLDYISRGGRLDLRDQDEFAVSGRAAMKALAEDWSAWARQDSQRRVDSPISFSLVLAMPSPTDAVIVRLAVQDFAREVFAGRFDHVAVMHTDTPHPHVHLAVRMNGEGGRRLNPQKVELEQWRQLFAAILRDRGVEAEATPRRARGVTRKSEHPKLRRIRERWEAGDGEPAAHLRAAYLAAAKAAFQGEGAPNEIEVRLLKRQAEIRGLYLEQAKALKAAPDSADKVLGARLEAFVGEMPPPDSRRLALARELRAAAHERAPNDGDLGRPVQNRPKERSRS